MFAKRDFLPKTLLLTFGAICCVLAPVRLASGQIRLDPPSLDFGDRGHHEKPSETVTVQNIGKTALTVREVRSSCSCIEVTPARLTDPIPAGGSVQLKVSMGSGRAMGKLEKYIAFHVGEAKTPTLTLPVKMRVFDGFSMAPLDLRFDGVVGGQPVTDTVDIKRDPRRGPFTLTVEAIRLAANPKPPSEHFSAKVTDISGGKRIEVTLKPTHPEGRIWGNVEAKLDGKLFIIPIAGEMFRWIKIVPNYFNFSKVSSDDPSSFVEESVLSSTDGRGFKILSMTPTFLGSVAAGTSLELGIKGGKLNAEATEHVIQARIVPPAQPTGSGSFSGKVRVETDHPQKPEIVLNFYGFFAQPKK